LPREIGITQLSRTNDTLQYDLGSYHKWIAGQGRLCKATVSFGRYTTAHDPRQVAMTLRFQF